MESFLWYKRKDPTVHLDLWGWVEPFCQDLTPHWLIDFIPVLPPDIHLSNYWGNKNRWHWPVLWYKTDLWTSLDRTVTMNWLILGVLPTMDLNSCQWHQQDQVLAFRCTVQVEQRVASSLPGWHSLLSGVFQCCEIRRLDIGTFRLKLRLCNICCKYFELKHLTMFMF